MRFWQNEEERYDVVDKQLVSIILAELDAESDVICAGMFCDVDRNGNRYCYIKIIR